MYNISSNTKTVIYDVHRYTDIQHSKSILLTKLLKDVMLIPPILMTIVCGLGFKYELTGVVHGCRISLRVWSGAVGSNRECTPGLDDQMRVWFET